MALDPIEIVGGLAIGEGLGGAIADTVEPRLQDFKNSQWAAHQDKPLGPETAAEVAAEEVDLYPTMEQQASYSGFDADRFADLYRVTLTAPGLGTLLTLLRRQHEVPIDFPHGLRKAKLANQWDAALANLASERLSPQQIALGIVRSVIADPGLLATTLDLSGGIVPAYPVWPGDALAEAETGGIDADRLRVMVGEIGLPMSAQQAASAYFRSIIKHGDFNRAILEGDTRPEWAPFILEQAREILTANQYAELQLRGFYDRATRLDNTGKHGMSTADSDLLYDVLGRSVSVHAVTTGLARGGTYPSVYADVPEPYRAAIQRSNIREEWVGLAYANRYSYPSGFQIRAEAQKGDLGPAETRELLLEVGWSPKWATFFADKWTAGTVTATDPHVAKAQTHLWNTVHASYKAEESTQADVTPALTALGIDAAAQSQIFALWDAERALIRAELSPKEIVKAVQEKVPNPATGAPWTLADGIAALLARGYSQADAETLLAE